MRLISSLLVIVLGAAIAGAVGAADPNALLDRLAGKWDMIGTVMKDPVRYRAEGKRVLNGGFLELHMIDVASPPQYEASVFIGYDAKAKDFIAHWLDGFGASGARVVGTGTQDGDRIVIQYPYAEGAFRNTFTWSPATRGWTLLIESQGKDGKWSPFASYTMTRTRP
jgi:hypothetical protein